MTATRRERSAHPLEGDGDSVRVFGEVRSAGKPVAGAAVRLYRGLRPQYEPVASATTAADGSFDLGENTLGDWTLVASARGTNAVALGPQGSPLRIELRPCRYPLRGVVRDTAGAPIPRAHIGGLWWGDEHGVYELCVDPKAPYLTFVADGYEPRGIVPSPRDRSIDVVLTRYSAIAGRVIREDNGHPIASLRVWSWGGATETEEDGTFLVGGLGPGKQHVSAGNEQWATETVEVDLHSEETATVTLHARKWIVVRGIVVDEDDMPVAEAQGCLQSGSCFGADTDGRFELHTRDRGEQSVTVSGRTSVTPSRVMIAPGAPEVVLKVGPEAPVVRRPEPRYIPSLRGRVLRLGVPVVGAGISLGDTTVTVTLADGTFEIDRPPGNYQLEAFSRELLASSLPVAVVLVAGETRDVTLELDQSAAISGLVVDERGAPVADVSVRVYSDALHTGAVVYVRRDGSFYVGALAPALYVPQVSRGDTRPLRLLSGGEIRVPAADSIVSGVRLIVETRTAAIAGRVIDRDGAPIAGAFVFDTERREPVACDSWEAELSPRTGPDGRFRFPSYPLGSSATLTAMTCDGGRAELSDVPAGNEDVVLQLPRP